MTNAYSLFQDRLEVDRAGLPGLTGYETAELANTTKGTAPWKWAVPGEIAELINIANAWGNRLHQWNAWLGVLEELPSEEAKWEVSDHFVEPIAYFCMLQPSGFLDRISIVTENVLHQANIRVFSGEPDRLDQDDLKPGAFLSRSMRKKQLDRLGERWLSYPALQQAMGRLYGGGYRNISRNFRDLSAHSFAPRFHTGHLFRAPRSKRSWQEMVEQPDGTFLLVDHPTKAATLYEMCEISPIPYKEARDANLAEYERAKHALALFGLLVQEVHRRSAE